MLNFGLKIIYRDIILDDEVADVKLDDDRLPHFLVGRAVVEP